MIGSRTCRRADRALANIPGDRKGQVFVFKSRGNIKTQWEGAIRRAGIKRLTTHPMPSRLRDGLLDMGVSPITVAGRGGWKSVRHVSETYGHDVAPADVTNALTGTPVTQTERKINVVK
jgi:integrase